MQIHELTQPKKSKINEVDWVGPDSVFNQAKSAWQTKGKSLWSPEADQEATQARYQDYAAKQIAQGQQRGYLEVPTLADSVAKLKSNKVAQQWINGVVAQWPAVSQQLATTATASAPTATASAPTATVAGQRLDPKNPKDAQVLAALARQGIKEAPEYTNTGGIVIPSGAKTASQPTVAPQQNTQAYADAFEKWIDSQLRTTNIEQLKASDPEVATQLDKILKEIMAAQNNLPQQQKLVHDFLSVAVAANHILQTKQRISGKYGLANYQQPRSGTADQAPAETGLTPMQLRTLGQAAIKAGGTNPTNTGNQFWNTVIQQALASANK
jgi:hypothetical protein